MDHRVIEVDNRHLEKPDLSDSYKKIREDMYENSLEDRIAICVLGNGPLEEVSSCVEAILKHTKSFSFDFYLIDNGSENQALTRYYEQVSYENKEVISFENQVSDQEAFWDCMRYKIRSKYLAFIRSQAVVEEDWLEQMLQCMKSDFEIGAVVPSKKEEKKQGAGENWKELLFWESPILLLRTQVFDDVGYYDRDYKTRIYEKDFAERLRHMGYRLMQSENANYRMEDVETINFGSTEWQQDVELYEKKHGNRSPFLQKETAWVSMLEEYDCKKEFGEKALFLNPGNGQEILQYKNWFCETGRTMLCGNIITEEREYFEDLRTLKVPGTVKIGSRYEMIEREKEANYDFIMDKSPLNAVKDGKRYLELVYGKLKKDGICMLRLENVSNYHTFLGCLKIEQKQEINLRGLYIEEVKAQIEALGGKNIKIVGVWNTEFQVEMKQMIEMLYRQMFDGDEETVRALMSKLYLKYYIITYQK